MKNKTKTKRRASATKEVIDITPPTVADAYYKTEGLLKSLESVKYMLEDTKDWAKMSEEHRKLSQENLKNFYIKSHFQMSCFRDELLLTLQRMPSVRLVRKGQREQKQEETFKN